MITAAGSLALSVTPYLNATTATAGSLDAFLLERYSAWCAARHRLMRFDIAHLPWRYRPAAVHCEDDSLLRATFEWFPDRPPTPLAHRCHALSGVRIGPPERVTSAVNRREGRPQALLTALFPMKSHDGWQSCGCRW